MPTPDDPPTVNPLDVIRILGEQIADLSKQLAVAQARAEHAERRLSAQANVTPMVPLRPRDA